MVQFEESSKLTVQTELNLAGTSQAKHAKPGYRFVDAAIASLSDLKFPGLLKAAPGQALNPSFARLQMDLVSYSQEQERRDRLNDAVAHSQLAVDLATEQYKAGLVDFLSVLDAQRGLYANEDQLVQRPST
jgi:hypothetical protein